MVGKALENKLCMLFLGVIIRTLNNCFIYFTSKCPFLKHNIKKENSTCFMTGTCMGLGLLKI